MYDVCLFVKNYYICNMKYFTIDELFKSSTAIAMGIDNTPSAEVVGNLTRLVDVVLDPLRKHWGAPLYVNSGYRCLAVNKAVGGAVDSDHLYGYAADITAGSVEKNEKLFKLVQKLNLPFRQLINENNFRWIHVSYNPNDIKKQILHL